MVLSDVLCVLDKKGLSVTAPQIRWAYQTKQIEKPLLDGSLRLDFDKKNVAEIVRYFEEKQAVSA